MITTTKAQEKRLSSPWTELTCLDAASSSSSKASLAARNEDPDPMTYASTATAEDTGPTSAETDLAAEAAEDGLTAAPALLATDDAEDRTHPPTVADTGKAEETDATALPEEVVTLGLLAETLALHADSPSLLEETVALRPERAPALLVTHLEETLRLVALPRVVLPEALLEVAPDHLLVEALDLLLVAGLRAEALRETRT